MKTNYIVEINYLNYWDSELEQRVLFPKLFKLNICCEPENLDLSVCESITNYLDDGIKVIDEFEFDYKIVKQI